MFAQLKIGINFPTKHSGDNLFVLIFLVFIDVVVVAAASVVISAIVAGRWLTGM
jgi:hypothetical protein